MGLNIFQTVKIYAGKWNEKSARALSKEEIEEVKSTIVQPSKWGLSLLMYLNSGGQVYFPIDKSSLDKVKSGDVVDTSKLLWVTLEKSGEADIVRARIVD